MAAWQHEEGAGEVHVEDLLPALERDLVGVLEAQDAGAVHEQVEAAAVLEGGGHRGGREGGVAHVADERGDARPGRAASLRGVGRARPRTMSTASDGGALVDQPVDGGPADARSGAGHQRHASLVPFHRARD